MKVKKCHMCTNCQTTDKWEALYKKFLEDCPQEKAFVNRQRRLDTKHLPCFYASVESEMLYAKAFEK